MFMNYYWIIYLAIAFTVISIKLCILFYIIRRRRAARLAYMNRPNPYTVTTTSTNYGFNSNPNYGGQPAPIQSNDAMYATQYSNFNNQQPSPDAPPSYAKVSQDKSQKW